MVALRNVSPLGALNIPALGITVEADEVFNAPDGIAANLIEQQGNFVSVEDE